MGAKRSAAPLAFCLAMLLSVESRAELAAVWALGESTKIKAGPKDADRALPVHPLAARNEVFDGKRLRLHGLRGETLGFQLILRGGDRETKDVSVALAAIGPIRNAPDVTDEGDRYYLGRRIELFVQHYHLHREASATAVWRPGTAAAPAPAQSQGWIPDALIPHRRPFSVEPRRRQGLWIDVYIPPNTPSGVHRGELVVKVGGEVCRLPTCRLPVELEVLDVVLPAAPAVKTMVYFSGWDDDRDGLAARYLVDWKTASRARLDALRARHYKLGRRHHLTLFCGNQLAPERTLAERLEGKAFTREAGYEGPGEGLGQDLVSVLTYGIGELDAAKARSWLAFARRHNPEAEVFYYAKDEPQDAAALSQAQRRAKAAKPMASLVTTRVHEALPDVDIFTVGTNQFSVKEARQAEARGKRVWVYNGNRPFSGTFVTDDVLAALRVNPWIQFKYRIPRWFYWESTYYKDFQGRRGQVDVWRDPLSFSNRFGDKLYGDGLLVYPGRDRRFPASDKGFDFPLPSLRLKAWRRGIQDVAYLKLLGARGLGAFVDEVVATMVPAALADELRADAPPSWPEDGERWVRARKLLFAALRSGEAPGVPHQRLARPAEGLGSRLWRELRYRLDPLLRSPKRRIVSGLTFTLLILLVALVLRARGRRRRRAPHGGES